jgi:hypothetical protein
MSPVRRSPSFTTCSDARRARSASSGGFRFMRSAVAPSTEAKNCRHNDRNPVHRPNRVRESAHLSAKQPIASGTFLVPKTKAMIFRSAGLALIRRIANRQGRIAQAKAIASKLEHSKRKLAAVSARNPSVAKSLLRMISPPR